MRSRGLYDQWTMFVEPSVCRYLGSLPCTDNIPVKSLWFFAFSFGIMKKHMSLPCMDVFFLKCFAKGEGYCKNTYYWTKSNHLCLFVRMRSLPSVDRFLFCLATWIMYIADSIRAGCFYFSLKITRLLSNGFRSN